MNEIIFIDTFEFFKIENETKHTPKYYMKITTKFFLCSCKILTVVEVVVISGKSIVFN